MRPKFLVTNDDSVNANGIKVLADSLQPLGDVIIVAPEEPRSGQSSALTVSTPLRLTLKETLEGGVPVYAVNGTPVDCVKLAMHTLFAQEPPAAIFAGINHGSNAAINVLYSGTMGAVLEGCTQEVPSVGFSLLDHSLKADFTECIPWIREIASKVVADGLPKGVCLNVNFPAKCQILGLKVCRAAHGRWTEEYREYTDPHGHPFYWLTGHFDNFEPDNDATDEYWLARQFVTVVPTSTDMTAPQALPDIEKLLK